MPFWPLFTTRLFRNDPMVYAMHLTMCLTCALAVLAGGIHRQPAVLGIAPPALRNSPDCGDWRGAGARYIPWRLGHSTEADLQYALL
jgi:hypothetical protein